MPRQRNCYTMKKMW